MRRITLPAGIALAVVAAPALALDLGRWLPSLEWPSWPRVEAPQPAFTPAPDAAPAAGVADAAPAPGATAPPTVPPGRAPEPRAAGADPGAAAIEHPRARPRGWRGLVPGSLQ